MIQIYKFQLLLSYVIIKIASSFDFFFYRGDQVVEVSPGVKKNVFRCIQWTKITDESYFYYIKNGKH